MHARSFVAAITLTAGLAASVHADVSIAFRNGVQFPDTAVDQHGATFALAGLSGLTALPDGRFAAVMDNSNKIVLFTPQFGLDGLLSSVSSVTGLTLSQTRDFEDIAAFPQGGSVMLCDEGTSNQLSAVNLLTGAVTGGPAVPAVYANARANFGLESLSISPDGLTMWTCNEEALSVDGAQSTHTAGTRVRLQKYARSNATGTGGFTPAGQWCYITQPMHGPAITGARSGVSALVALPGGELLVMERSFAFNSTTLFLTRIYSVSTSGAQDTSATDALAGMVIAPCVKTTRYAGSHTNLEGLALGPAAVGGPVGRRVMLGIVDNGDPISSNRLVSFVIDGIPADAGCGPADCGSQGGEAGPDGSLDNNDFIVFIDNFFGRSPSADLGRQGGVGPGDGQFNNDDFVVFIDLFFSGC